MRRVLGFLGLCLLSGAAFAMERLEPVRACPLTDLPRPLPVSHPQCAPGHCVDLGRGRRLCKCLIDEDGEMAEMLYTVGREIIQRWPVETFLGETEDFHVLRGDLRGDGRQLWSIPNRTLTSQGIGVSFWTIYVLDPDKPNRAPISWSVSDYGPGSFAVPQGRTEKGCDILLTEWIEGHEPHRGNGLYYVGRWSRLGADGIEPHPTRRPRTRRYLFSFERERHAMVDYNDDMTPNFKGFPAKWLRPRKARPLNASRRFRQ